MRLIDANALHDTILRDEKLDGKDVNWAVNRIISHILNAPTIDSLDLDVNIGGRRCGKRQRLLDELRPKGKWIHHEQVTGLGGYWKCSSCGEPAIFTPRLHINNVQIYSWDNNKTNYCSNCGADMRGKENEREER